eukprot:TRINITY_DN1892_c0_g1_i3.p2 TRINITY_DN1892_c0_g1~~TRINITY_DN1892_c0_g1_i3.p2  ORF type:complete len:109 (-),score=1.86 TRINITY_DN1892_c0_g1_i3:243-569(-)
MLCWFFFFFLFFLFFFFFFFFSFNACLKGCDCIFFSFFLFPLPKHVSQQLKRKVEEKKKRKKKCHVLLTNLFNYFLFVERPNNTRTKEETHKEKLKPKYFYLCTRYTS